MNNSDLCHLADAVRPLLADLGAALSMCEGFLGVAFFPSEYERYPVFGNRIGRDFTPHYVRTEQKEIEKHRRVRYTLPAYHPLVRSLQSDDGATCTLSRNDAKSTRDGREDVWVVLTEIFGGADNVPAEIQIWRVWLLKDKSALYYLPANQQSTTVEWDGLSRLSILASHSLRTNLISKQVSDSISDEKSELLLACLPEHLPDYERRLMTILAEHKEFSKIVRVATITADWDSWNHRIRISVQIGHDAVDLITIGYPTEPADLQRFDATWVEDCGPAGSTNKTAAYRLIFSLIVIRQICAQIVEKSNNQTTMLWSQLWPFVYPNEQIPADRFVQEKLPEEYMDSEGDPLGIVETVRTNSISGAKLVKRVSRTDRYVQTRVYHELPNKLCPPFVGIESTANGPQFYLARELTITPRLRSCVAEATKGKGSVWVRQVLAQVMLPDAANHKVESLD